LPPNFLFMAIHEDIRQTECVQMPDVVDALISKEEYPHLSAEQRAKFKAALLEIEGSPKDGGMTCIAKEDFERASNMVKGQMGTKAPEDPGDFEDPDRLQAFMRGLNKSCDACLIEDCRIRLEWTRAEVKALSLPGEPKSYRRLRLSLPTADTVDELECA